MCVTCQMMQADSSLDIPDSNARVPRSGHSDRTTIENLEASNRRCVAMHRVKALPEVVGEL